ncbi:hypothetical protein GQ44DRAFT_722985 [Phaeosphaeriaceae sp. PMI808]|nr:hypothetical protein GQ44DRAFT_722985 [Phaeosphaeriaceae sp. PMI808]
MVKLILKLNTASMAPPKRMQSDTATTNSPTALRENQNTANTRSLKRKASEQNIITTSVPPTAKKIKTSPSSKPKATTTEQRSRKAATKNVKKKPTPPSPIKSNLMPRGDRKKAFIGQKDETLLRMVCDDAETGEAKELHFRNMPHSAIDWHDASHISKINNWRNQIYGRAGIKSKAVSLWLPDEELWFELHFQLTIAESRVRGILLPKTSAVLQSFNETFVGRVIRDCHGFDTEPRVERNSNAFASKFNRMCPGLRARLNQSVFGRSGDSFVPGISVEMLEAYKRMKGDMERKGIENESAYSEHLGSGCISFRICLMEER